MKYLISIVGPTAVGKTKLSLEIAERLHTEIISCDSRQFYKELNIGTAKPSQEELRRVPHHFINNLSLHDRYSVKDYEEEVITVLESLFQQYNVVVMVGGSGLFYKAICEGLDEIPDVNPAIRMILLKEMEEKGIDQLKEELQQRDPFLFATMDVHNTQRVIRALEVCRGAGKPFSTFRNGKGKKRDFSIVKIGLEQSAEALYDRINHRMDVMLSEGLLEEAKLNYAFRDTNALQTVGYKEIYGFLDGEYDWEECVRLLKRNSRRYAKRQMTWFRKDAEIQWYNWDNYEHFDLLFEAILKQSLSHLD